MKKTISIILCLIMGVSIFSGISVSAYDVDVDEFVIGGINSGQILDSSDSYYELDITSKTTFSIDFDATYNDEVYSKYLYFKIIKKAYLNDYTIGKDVPYVYNVMAQTSIYNGCKNYWYDGMVTLSKGKYVIILNNDSSYMCNYTLLLKKVTLKLNQKINVKKYKKSISFSKLRRKKLKIRAFTLNGAQGKVTYKLIKSGTSAKIWKYLKINKKGVITVKKWKKAKKGTYSIRIKVTASGNGSYKKGSKTATIKIKIK